MALEFKDKLEAINFGGMVLTPKIDMEKRLRLKQADLKTADGIRETMTIIAECFDDKADDVRAFIDENLSLIDIAQLQVYLIGGQKMLDTVNKKLEEGMDE